MPFTPPHKVQTQAPHEEVSHVSVKPPQFFRSNPSIWFRQLESSFCLAKITAGQTKFHHALSSLPEDIACEVVTDEIKTYDALKEAVISYFTANKHQLIEKALSAIELGDKRPTQLVNEIRRRFSEIGLKADDSIIKSRLLTALPANLRSALVGHEEASVEQYAKIADSMMAVTSNITPFQGLNNIQEQGTRNAFHSNRRPNFSQKTSGVRAFYEGQRPRICNSHIFYADQAKSCRHWCRWPGIKPKMLDNRDKTPYPTRQSTPHRLNK